jgi:hypothetical protein
MRNVSWGVATGYVEYGLWPIRTRLNRLSWGVAPGYSEHGRWPTKSNIFQNNLGDTPGYNEIAGGEKNGQPI